MPLGVHIIGGGFGESIVLELPDQSVGVIDSYRHPGSARYPLRNFLLTQPGLVPRPLRFAAITHPHADHCLGIMDLIEELGTDKLLVFRCVAVQALREYLVQLKDRGTPDAVEAALGVAAGTTADEIMRLTRHVRQLGEQWHRGGATTPKPYGLIAPRQRYEFTCGPETVVLQCLTPGDIQNTQYEAQVTAAVRPAMSAVASAGSPPKPSVNPNLASGVMAVEYGSTRLLLMADAETPVWQEWLVDLRQYTDLAVSNVHFLKVAHHGSSNGYEENVYRRVAANRPVGILTPFNKQKNQKLPSASGLRLIRPYLSDVLCTNRLEAAKASGLEWDHCLPNPRPAIPPDWLGFISRNRKYIQILSPHYGGPKKPANLQLPAGWWKDCLGNPTLLYILHQDLPQQRAILARLDVHEVCRVSLYFDDGGDEITSRRFVGVAAGLLRL